MVAATGSIRRGACRLAFVTLLLCLGFVSFAHARMTDWEAQVWSQRDVAGKMELVSKMYYDGRAADAADAIVKLLGENPADKELVKATDKLTPALRAHMIADPATSEKLKLLLDAVDTAAQHLRTDQAYIDSVVAQIKSGDGESWQAVQRCLQLGEYVVPAIVGALAESHEGRQQVALGKTLVLMGPRAVRPLSEGLWLSNPAAVVQVCDILGDIRSELALGALSDVLADNGRSEDVHKAAARAMAKIHTSGYCKISERSSAPGYYYTLADAYLHKSSFTLPTMIDTKTLPVWTWSADNKKIEGREVASELYPAVMAEKCCAAGLGIDKESTALRALLISSLMSQKLAGKPADADLQKAILAGGEPALYGSLGKALSEGDADIAIVACQTLGAVTTGKGIPEDRRQDATNPLLSALTYPYRSVRLAAAEAIVAQGPIRTQGNFEDVNMVLPALSWGLMYQMPSKCVLVAHSSEAVTGKYRQLLTDAGYRMTEALTPQAMMAKAAALPKPDIVFMDAAMTDSLRQLRTVLMDPGVHVVLIVDDIAAGHDLVAKYADDGVVAALPANASDKQLTAAFALIPKSEAAAKLVAQLLPDVSQHAAETLASINPQVASFPMGEIVPSLRQALAYKEDAIRVPALKALGSIGASESIADILKVVNKVDNSKPVKLAALQALSAIFEGTGEVNPDVFAVLVPLTDSDDTDIALAASRAVSVAKFDPDQFADLVLKKRVQDLKAGEQK